MIPIFTIGIFDIDWISGKGSIHYQSIVLINLSYLVNRILYSLQLLALYFRINA